MQQKSLLVGRASYWLCVGLGVLGLVTTAASPAFAGTWDVAPDGGGYMAEYAHTSVYAATKTAGTTWDENFVSGLAWDTNNRTHVKFIWAPGSPFEITPTPTAGTFSWEGSGNVESVSELYGIAEARLEINPSGSSSQGKIYGKRLNRGNVEVHAAVPNDFGDPHSAPCYVTAATGGTAEIDFSQSIQTSAMAAAATTYGGNASATSAAATLSTVMNSGRASAFLLLDDANDLFFAETAPFHLSAPCFVLALYLKSRTLSGSTSNSPENCKPTSAIWKVAYSRKPMAAIHFTR